MLNLLRWLVPRGVYSIAMNSSNPEPFDFVTPRLDSGSGSDDGVTYEEAPLNVTESTKKRTITYAEGNQPVEQFMERFTTTRNYTKRTPLQKRMANESFEPANQPIFRQNKSGFCTARPVQWMIAVEKYIDNNEDVRARWRYKVDDNEKFYEVEISIWFNTTTEVLVRISILTGIFMVEGASFRKFIDNEFEKVAVYVEKEVAEEKEDGATNDEDEDTVWSKIDENAKAVKLVEGSVLKLFEIIEETNRKHHLVTDVSQSLKQDEILELEKKYDNKLKVFMEAYEKDVIRKIENVCRRFDQKIEQMSVAIGNFKISTQRQINELYELCAPRGDEIPSSSPPPPPPLHTPPPPHTPPSQPRPETPPPPPPPQTSPPPPQQQSPPPSLPLPRPPPQPPQPPHSQTSTTTMQQVPPFQPPTRQPQQQPGNTLDCLVFMDK